MPSCFKLSSHLDEMQVSHQSIDLEACLTKAALWRDIETLVGFRVSAGMIEVCSLLRMSQKYGDLEGL